MFRCLRSDFWTATPEFFQTEFPSFMKKNGLPGKKQPDDAIN